MRGPIESVVKFQDNARIVNARYGQRGVRVGEASHPGPSRRRRTHRVRPPPWVWDGSDSELEDDRNVVPRRVDPFVPFDVVEALEQDLREPVTDSGSGLVPTLLDDVEQDLAVLCTEIPATLPASSGSVPIEFRSGNRFAAVADHGEAHISQQDFMSGRRRRVRRRVVATDSGTPVGDARTDGGNRRPSRPVFDLTVDDSDGTNVGPERDAVPPPACRGRFAVLAEEDKVEQGVSGGVSRVRRRRSVLVPTQLESTRPTVDTDCPQTHVDGSDTESGDFGVGCDGNDPQSQDEDHPHSDESVASSRMGASVAEEWVRPGSRGGRSPHVTKCDFSRTWRHHCRFRVFGYGRFGRTLESPTHLDEERAQVPSRCAPVCHATSIGCREEGS